MGFPPTDVDDEVRDPQRDAECQRQGDGSRDLHASAPSVLLVTMQAAILIKLFE
jgi:hypothetical protein